jgi:hypothetical protein
VRTVGKDWLFRIGDPAGDRTAEGNDCGSMHAAAASAGNAAFRCEPTAVQQRQRQTTTCVVLGASDERKNDRRMRGSGGASQEARTVRGGCVQGTTEEGGGRGKNIDA